MVLFGPLLKIIYAFSCFSEEDMKVAANFVLYFTKPEDKALRYLSNAISNNYLQSMPVFKNTLLRDGTSLICNLKKIVNRLYR